MAVFKCKICDGDLNVQAGMSVCECEYCGTRQTLPKIKDDRRANLYDRANHFRRNNEFDKAMSMYEQILQEDREDAEAYWSLVLCTYGIEYVEDPASHIRKPTVNRTQFTSVFADENYRAALQYADEKQRQIYEEEARQIDGIQKGILDISGKEDPFDVFICYKETDASGRRTQDSVLANDLYHQLTQEGFKVFFARITLEDKLGSAYEPYIFAALNSAKVMVVLGTRAEYFNAVWVRNEWSRYLSLIKGGAKKVLIPAYKDMDPYDLPQEFSHLQSQDMGKLGFMQDLIRGIRKLTGADQPAQPAAAAGASGNEAAALLKRAFLFMEDGDFARGDEYCERVLNMDPENGEAYLGKLMVQLRVRKRENLALVPDPDTLEQTDAYRKVMRFGSDAVKSELEGYNQQIIRRLQEQQEKQQEEAYQGVLKDVNSAVKSGQLKEMIGRLRTFGDYKDAAAQTAAAEEKLALLEKKERETKKKKRRRAAKVGMILAAAVIIASAALIIILYIQAVLEVESDIQKGEYYSASRIKVAYDGPWREYVVGGLDEQLRKRADKAARDAVLNAVKTEEYEKAAEIWLQMPYCIDDKTKVDQKLVDAMLGTLNATSGQNISYGDQVKRIHRALWNIGEVEQLRNTLSQAVQQHVSAGEYDKAGRIIDACKSLSVYSVGIGLFQDWETYKQLLNAVYQAAEQHLSAGEYDKAEDILQFLKSYKYDDQEAFERLERILQQAGY